MLSNSVLESEAIDLVILVELFDLFSLRRNLIVNACCVSIDFLAVLGISFSQFLLLLTFFLHDLIGKVLDHLVHFILPLLRVLIVFPKLVTLLCLGL